MPMLLLFRLLFLLLLLMLQSSDDGLATVVVAAHAQKPHEKRNYSRNPYIVLAETFHEGIALLAEAVILFM